MQRRRTHVIGLALAIALGPVLSAAAQAQPAGPDPSPEAPAEPGERGTIRGTVEAQATGAPLAGAEVSVAGTDARAVADAQGRYTLTRVPPGTHTVEAVLVGYLAQSTEVRVGDAPVSLDFRLADDPAFSEVIVIVGSRTERTALQTPVPVDVISSDVLRQGGQQQTNQALASVAPSYQANHQTVADGSDHVNPASMRGLGPDQVLVLINGKRRHNSALIHTTDSFGRGSTGVDLNAIPASSIQRIEVLRDGASAQYGSDAIAGVINVVLKDDVVSEVKTMTGITGSGDGFEFLAGVNDGFRIGDKGVFNITGEFLRRNPTNRAGTWTGSFYGADLDYDETTALLAARGLTRDDVRMRVGQARATVGSVMYNARLPSSGVEYYSFGGATLRTGDATGFYRLPEEENRADLSVYPNGFLPEIHTRIVDWSLALGGRTEIKGWKLDLSGTHGGNLFLFQIQNSVNASLGAAGGAALGAAASGTSFDAGGQAFLQTTLNADAVRGLDIGAVKKMSLVLGTELRVENFRQIAGEPASYAIGDQTTSAGIPKIPGSQVFPGYTPDNELSKYRTSVGAYAGVESEITDRLLVDVAGRFENFSDFGSTLIGKIASRLDIIDQLALRAAVSNGFRAPSLHQVWFSAISTQFESVEGQQEAQQVLLPNNHSELAMAFGIPELKEETSLNLSAGFTARPASNLSLAVDFYRITIQDRIALSKRFHKGVPGVAELLEGFPGVSQAEFFVNAADTETEGVDIVVDYLTSVARGDLQLTAAANFTRSVAPVIHIPPTLASSLGLDPSDVEAVENVLFGNQERNRLEDLLPKQRATLSARYVRGLVSGLVRSRYYGSIRYAGYADDGSEDETFGAKVLFDVDLGYRFAPGWTVAVGADNLFNTFPDEHKVEANRYFNQFRYRPDQFGMNGGFYYLRLQYLQ
jgi:iron complex outermembrane recepter protein